MKRLRITTGAASILRGLGAVAVRKLVDPKDHDAALAAVEMTAGAFEDGIGLELQIGTGTRRRRRLKASRGSK